jgi:hypothetical protein
MKTENSTRSTLLKIFAFTFASCLVIKLGVYFYALEYFSYWSETQAKVIAIEKIKDVQGTRAGYSISIDLQILKDSHSTQDQKVIHDWFGLSSHERWLFLEKTKPNQIIPIWMNDKYHAIEIIQPVRPEMFSNFLWFLGIAGPIFFVIGIVIFGEKVERK